MATPSKILAQKRAKSPSRQKSTQQHAGRFILSNKEIAKTSAKAQITRGINKGNFLSTAGKGGQDLHFSVIKMGESLGAPPELMDALYDMDPDKLQALYDNNDLVFDVFFDYRGVDDAGDFRTISDDKMDDVKFFIEQYQRAFK